MLSDDWRLDWLRAFNVAHFNEFGYQLTPQYRRFYDERATQLNNKISETEASRGCVVTEINRLIVTHGLCLAEWLKLWHLNVDEDVWDSLAQVVAYLYTYGEAVDPNYADEMRGIVCAKPYPPSRLLVAYEPDHPAESHADEAVRVCG